MSVQVHSFVLLPLTKTSDIQIIILLDKEHKVVSERSHNLSRNVGSLIADLRGLRTKPAISSIPLLEF